MNPLDARARSASMAIQDSLAAAAAPASFATVARRALIAKAVNLVLIGAGATMFIAAGAAFRTPQPETPVAETVVSTTSTTTDPSTTTAPPGTSVVALPPATVGATSTAAPLPGSTTVAPSTPSSTTASPTTTTTSTTTTTTTTTTTPTTTEPPDTEPPEIRIVSPENRQKFNRKEILMRGVTEPGAEVRYRNRTATMSDDGRWSIPVLLEPGRNRLTVVATDAAGNSAEASVLVVYVPPDLAPFRAHAEFGTCSEDPPYDIYYGTGEPGTSVGITSEYGSGVTSINAAGEWEIKVFFPSAPHGETFVVRAVDEFGRSKAFEFTSYAGDGKKP